MKTGELYCKRKTEFALQLLVTASLFMVCFLEYGLMSANTDQANLQAAAYSTK